VERTGAGAVQGAGGRREAESGGGAGERHCLCVSGGFAGLVRGQLGFWRDLWVGGGWSSGSSDWTSLSHYTSINTNNLDLIRYSIRTASRKSRFARTTALGSSVELICQRCEHASTKREPAST
jgi:hypothetical protein